MDYYAWGVVEQETNKHTQNIFSSLKDVILSTVLNMSKQPLIRTCSRFQHPNESVIAANGDFIEYLYSHKVN